MKSIQMINKEMNKQNIILSFIIITMFICMLYSKFVKKIDFFEIYFPYIIFGLLFFLLEGILTKIKLVKLKSNRIISDELNNILAYCQGAYMVTNNYIIKNLSVKKMISYNDIILVYTKNKYANRSIEEHLYLVLKNGKIEKFVVNTTAMSFGYDGEPCNFMKFIIEKNKNVLVGNNEHNRDIILKKYGIKIPV